MAAVRRTFGSGFDQREHRLQVGDVDAAVVVDVALAVARAPAVGRVEEILARDDAVAVGVGAGSRRARCLPGSAAVTVAALKTRLPVPICTEKPLRGEADLHAAARWP